MKLSNNDIYKKITIALSLKDQDCMRIFEMGGYIATRSYCKFLLKADDNSEFKELTNEALNCFLQGLIIYKRELNL